MKVRRPIPIHYGSENECFEVSDNVVKYAIFEAMDSLGVNESKNEDKEKMQF